MITSTPGWLERLRQPRSPRTVTLWLAIWLAIVGNLALWRELYRIGGGASAFGAALGVFVVVLAVISALMLLTAWGPWMKPLWIAILLAAGVAQHFMLTYGVVMDPAMLANTAQTDPREVRDLLGWAFVANMLLVVAVPLAVLAWVPVRRTRWWPQLRRNASWFLVAVAVAAVGTFAMFSRIAPLVRNHMHLRFIVNPIAGFTSAIQVGVAPYFRRSKQLVPITAGTSLGASYTDQAKPPLLVMVVGETARADHFSLNGYTRDTNPELAAAGVLSFRDVLSCGTDTRDSVPCLFSPLGRAAFVKRSAEHENLLDVLQAAGLAVLWLDNQPGCKEVCARVPTASTSDLPAAAKARLCNAGECLDDALLVGLDERIARLPEERRKKGVVVVMHQMGSHGPAYYKRSAPAQKRFLPECTNTALGQCENQQLINAYDNTIVATDHFLAETIVWLKTQAGEFAPALLYVSDHGESLGEFGIFLHGLPYAFAPDVQKQVPLIAWLAPAMATRVGLDVDCVRASIAAPLSHDNVFHSVLGLLDVTTPTYRAPLDAFAACRTAKAKAS